MSAERLLAGLALLVCVALLARMLLPWRLRQRIDRWLRQRWALLRHHLQRLWQSPARRRAAARDAEAAIRRAREGSPDGRWDGNVYRPKSFRKPRKPH